MPAFGHVVILDGMNKKTTPLLLAAALTLSSGLAHADADDSTYKDDRQSAGVGFVLLGLALGGTSAGLLYGGATYDHGGCTFCIDLNKEILIAGGVAALAASALSITAGIVLVADAEPHRPAKLEARVTTSGVALGGSF